jgi:hypothetical protein
MHGHQNIKKNTMFSEFNQIYVFPLSHNTQKHFVAIPQLYEVAFTVSVGKKWSVSHIHYLLFNYLWYFNFFRAREIPLFREK